MLMKCGLCPSLARVPESLHFKRELKSDLRHPDSLSKIREWGLGRSWGDKLSDSIGSSTATAA